MKEKIFFYIGILSSFLPKLKNVVLFNSFYGLYNDNPKYISLYLHEICPNLKFYWVSSLQRKDEFPNYVKPIRKDSFIYFLLVNMATVVVDNYSGMRSRIYKHNSLSSYYLSKLISRRLSKQLNISTWHGTPLKKIGLDAPGNGNIGICINTDIMLSGCHFLTEKLRTCFRCDITVKEVGTPRNDIFFNQIDVISLKEKLGLPNSRSIILYAPTFRNEPSMSGANQVIELCESKVMDVLENTFGGQWSMVVRAHNLVLDNINIAKLREKYPNLSIINGNEHDDMAEYLACTDILLTDYSSSMFDFAISKKPCLLYCPDLDEYTKNDRGFYISVRDLPFPLATDVNDLIKLIESFDKDNYESQLDCLLGKMGFCENGVASKYVAEMIQSFLN